MELQEFITSTLESIINGVKDANSSLGDKGNYELSAGKDGEVLFDIAITVNEESKKSGGGSIKVYALSIGGEKGNTTSQENVSRIKFKIHPKEYIS